MLYTMYIKNFAKTFRYSDEYPRINTGTAPVRENFEKGYLMLCEKRVVTPRKILYILFFSIVTHVHIS